jgi:hypothetical protein
LCVGGSVTFAIPTRSGCKSFLCTIINRNGRCADLATDVADPSSIVTVAPQNLPIARFTARGESYIYLRLKVLRVKENRLRQFKTENDFDLRLKMTSAGRVAGIRDGGPAPWRRIRHNREYWDAGCGVYLECRLCRESLAAQKAVSINGKNKIRTFSRARSRRLSPTHCTSSIVVQAVTGA